MGGGGSLVELVALFVSGRASFRRIDACRSTNARDNSFRLAVATVSGSAFLVVAETD